MHLPLKGPNKDLLPIEATRHEFGHVQDMFSRPDTFSTDARDQGSLYQRVLFPERTPRYQAEINAWQNAGTPEDHPARKAALSTYSTHMRGIGIASSLGIIGAALLGGGYIATRLADG